MGHGIYFVGIKDSDAQIELFISKSAYYINAQTTMNTIDDIVYEKLNNLYQTRIKEDRQRVNEESKYIMYCVTRNKRSRNDLLYAHCRLKQQIGETKLNAELKQIEEEKRMHDDECDKRTKDLLKKIEEETKTSVENRRRRLEMRKKINDHNMLFIADYIPLSDITR